MDSSERSKRRKTEDVRAKFSYDELAYAAQMSLRAVGKVDASHVLKDIVVSSPSRPLKYRKALKQVREKPFSSDKALSLIIEGKTSKTQYNLMRSTSLQKNCILYPAYKYILQSKNECYPNESFIKITENAATVELQGLLNYTLKRILTVQKEVIESLPDESLNELTFIIKWGCDGSSGQSNYKPNFIDTETCDDNIFLILLVPLQLNSSKNADLIVWKNPRPSSPRFCRPIKIQFLKVTSQATINEVNLIKEEVKTLTSLKVEIAGKKISVNYQLCFTMVDGKVCNSVTNTTSAMRCFICQETSKNFNNIDKLLKAPLKEENLLFGIFSLHAWIRFFECVLHLSYKLTIKKWQNRTQDNLAVDSRKKMIQQRFREELGLIVDNPKQGYGSSNDGNTSRNFFENWAISARITEVNEDVIQRFYVVCQVISCGYEIDIKKFENYSLQTARKFVELYPWYYMPTSVHKILIHGSKIIESSLLPIGQMSEEKQEACHKDIKN